MNYLQILVEQIHSATIATIDSNNHPQTRIIDMMDYDEKGIYFLTAKGKEFYTQLMKQKYVAISATKDKKSVSLRGNIKNIGKERLDLLFDKNPYMKDIYPNDTRDALEVFCLYEATGEYFDISNPSHIFRETIVIGKQKENQFGYFINTNCNGCSLCYNACPQKCINTSSIPYTIDQHHCLHCARCVNICPNHAIEKRGDFHESK